MVQHYITMNRTWPYFYIENYLLHLDNELPSLFKLILFEKRAKTDFLKLEDGRTSHSRSLCAALYNDLFKEVVKFKSCTLCIIYIILLIS